MKIDVDAVLKDPQGKEIPDPATKKPFTLKDALVQVLLMCEDKEYSKVELYKLGMLVAAGGVVEMASEQITMCKKLMESSNYLPLIAGQAIMILEGN